MQDQNQIPAWAEKLIEDQSTMIEQLKGLLEDKPASQTPEPEKKEPAKLDDTKIKSIVHDLMKN